MMRHPEMSKTTPVSMEITCKGYTQHPEEPEIICRHKQSTEIVVENDDIDARLVQ